MAVAPEQRRKGIGESLLKRLLQAFKEAGADFVLLDCPAEAVEAGKLYEKVGFGVRFKELKMRL
jgi:ribosomal protein S18 acetylase RimI-like enzyme